jgi:hypothetical protein
MSSASSILAHVLGLNSLVHDEFSLLPRDQVEPSQIDVITDALSGCCVGARVAAACGLSASDVRLAERSPYVIAGRDAQWELMLEEIYTCRQPIELVVALNTLARHVNVFVVLEGQLLETTLVAEPSRAALVLACRIPGDAPQGAEVLLRVTVAGKSLCNVPSVRFKVARGMIVPSLLKGGCTSFSASHAISADGTYFAPESSNETCVPVFAADGSALQPLPLSGKFTPHTSRPHLLYCGAARPASLLSPLCPLAALGLETGTRTAAIDVDSDTLLLSDRRRLIAVDIRTRLVRWSSKSGSFMCGMGIAVLPSCGFVVASCYSAGKLYVHRLSDGERLGTLPISSGQHMTTADSASYPTGTVYVAERGGVHVYQVAPSGSLSHLMAVPSALTEGSDYRVLAVMRYASPTLGRLVLHLVVASWSTKKLRVLAIPSHDLVCELDMGFTIVALTADPHGTALAVGDGDAEVVRVLPWPLNGMPLV